MSNVGTTIPFGLPKFNKVPSISNDKTSGKVQPIALPVDVHAVHVFNALYVCVFTFCVNKSPATFLQPTLLCVKAIGQFPPRQLLAMDR